MSEGVTRSGAQGSRSSDSVGRMWWKRPLDLTLGVSLAVGLLPVLCALALLVRMESGGPIFFLQERVGIAGRRFNIYKFRTMHLNSDENPHRAAAARWFAGHTNGNGFKSLHDPRITRVGRFLRRFSLDELPQLLNVLRGEMSLVGPRPAIPYELEYYLPAYFDRQRVPPGITGLWQVSGRDRVSAARMMEIDLRYVREASLWLDLRILARTAAAVLSSAVRAE